MRIVTIRAGGSGLRRVVLVDGQGDVLFDLAVTRADASVLDIRLEVMLKIAGVGVVARRASFEDWLVNR